VIVWQPMVSVKVSEPVQPLVSVATTVSGKERSVSAYQRAFHRRRGSYRLAACWS